MTQYIADEKGEMRAVRLRNVKTNEERELAVACVFVAIGHDPNTKAYRGKLDMDPEGYLLAEKSGARVNTPAFSSPATWLIAFTSRPLPLPESGCAAALQAEKYLSEIRALICNLRVANCD